MEENYYITKHSKNSFFVWIPYLQELKRKGKGLWKAAFQGGELDLDLRKVESLTFYGKSDANIPLAFFYDTEQYGVQLCFYTRNRKKRVLLSHNAKQGEDIISRQILAREDLRRQLYIARTVVKYKLKSQNWLIAYDPANYSERLSSSADIDSIRKVESIAAKRYWSKYFKQLGLDVRRGDEHPINKALDAGYFFIASSIMRWLHRYGFSLFHGYLHTKTSYDSLVWDLIEPYRCIVDKAVYNIYAANGNARVGKVIEKIKASLENDLVWTQATYQYVYRKNLLSGIVLALRAYLLGARHLVIPIAGKKLGGRPPKVEYSLPGEVFQEQIKRRSIKVFYE